MRLTSRKLLEIKINNTFTVFFFFLSLAALEVLLLLKLSQSLVAVSEHIWRLEIELNADSGSPGWGGGAQNKDTFVCLLPRGKVAGRWIQRGQGERAAWACFACTGACVGEGADRRRSAASSSQTTDAQKEETSWGHCDTSRSFSISLLTCLPHTTTLCPPCNMHISTSNGLPIIGVIWSLLEVFWHLLIHFLKQLQ